MGISWTKAQQEVIESQKGSLLVSAAAGSGKTAVLVERILQRICNPNDPLAMDNILVVTFTRAAAAQMKDKIRQAMEQKRGEEPDNAYLQLQAGLLDYAQIQTIDSFCLSVVRRYFHVLGLDPSFRMGEEGELKLMRADVLEELMEETYQLAEEDFEGFASIYGSDRSDEGILSFIETLYNFAQSHPYPERWIQDILKDYEGIEEEDWKDRLRERAWIKEVCQVWGLRDQLVLYDRALALCDCPYGPAYAKSFLQDEKQRFLEMIEAVEKAEEDLDYEGICRALQGMDFKTLPRKKKDDEVDEGLRDQMKGLRTLVKDSIRKMVGNGRDKKGLYSYTMDEIRQGLFLSWPDAKVIVRLTLVFSERYQQAKQEKNLADFSDVQHMALQLLVEEGRPTAIAQVYREQFEEIYIDEYQDSNEVQELLLQAISREDEGEPNRFMVGDVKQSIYMFRQARPQIFMEKYEDYSEEAGAPFRKIELSHNFRSRWEVLEGINALFFRLMTKGLGGIAYTERTALHPGAMYPDLEGEKAPRVQMLWMDLSQDEVEKEGALEEVEQEQEDAMVWEARLVAMKIREVTDPLHGLKLWDGERQQFRKAEYRDIVILMRSLTGSMESWMEVMEKEGIPCYGETRTGYFDAFEVQSVLQFLRLLDNPLQDIPLASVMHGPMGGFSSLELAILKQLTERYIGTSFFYRIFSLPQEQVLKEQPQHRLLLEKVTAFSKWLQEKRDEAGRLPLHEFLRHALEETGYMYYVGAMPNGKKRLANLEMLMEKAMTYEETSYHGLFHFVRYVEQLQKYAVDVPQPSLLGETENVVRIMTIHKSKGLEFPIVFLSGMHKKFNMQDTRKNMLMHPALGMAMDATKKDYRLRVRTLNKQVLARRIQLDTQGEELRILYVAMTRAREYLFLTGAKDKLQEYLGKKRLVSAVEGENGALPYVTLAGGNSFMDWVVAASVGIQEDLISEQIWTNDMLTVVRAEEREQEWDQASTLENLALEQSQTAYWFPLWDAHVLGKYPYEVETTQKAIVSVSALKKESMRQEELDVTSSFEIWEKKQDKSEGISAAQRGTMYHKALELMDFTSGKLKDSPHVDWKVVQKTHLLQLWKSPLGRRMQQAAQKGKLHKEQQFLMGLPLYEDTEKAAEGPFRLIRGIIDVFWEEEDGLVLLDYKTDHLPDEDWEKVLVDRYHTQLEYYGLALEKMTRKPVKEIWLYAISKNKAIKV